MSVAKSPSSGMGGGGGGGLLNLVSVQVLKVLTRLGRHLCHFTNSNAIRKFAFFVP